MVSDAGPNGAQPALHSLVGLLKLLWSLVPRRFGMVLVLMMLAGLTEGVSLLVLVTLLDAVGLSVDGSAVGGVTAAVGSLYQRLGLPLTLTTSLVVFVLLVSARALLVFFETSTTLSLENRVVALVRKRLYEAITAANWLYLSRNRNAHFTFMLTEEIDRLDSAVHAVLTLLITAVMVLVYLGLAFYVSVPLTVMVLGLGLGLLLSLQSRTRLARKKGRAVSEAYESLYSAADEHLAGIKTSKSHGFENSHAAEFIDSTERVQNAHQGVVDNMALAKFWFEVGAVVTLAVTLYVSLRLFGLALDGVLLLLFLFSRLIPKLSRLQAKYQSLLSNLPAYTNVFGLIAQTEAAAEPQTGLGPAPALEQAVQLNSITFRYQPDAPAVFESFTMTLEANKTTALVGPSGAGKSTLADLVIGLLSPQQGGVMVDGVPLPTFLQTWRQSLGYVAQTTFLFNDTVRGNLLVARPNASEAELFDALEAAAALEFVTQLPEGIDTVVGERGTRLSGGERQRLALARALLRKPALLVLDEATSSLDIENERHIQDALERLQGKITVLLIAHRLATVSRADLIYVMEQGHIVEEGTWQGLLSRREGKFRSWCQAQGLVAAESAFGSSLR